MKLEFKMNSKKKLANRQTKDNTQKEHPLFMTNLSIIFLLLSMPSLVLSSISACKEYSSPSLCKTCEEGHFLSPGATICLPCVFSCVSCSNSHSCLTCKEGYFFNADTNQCVSCPSGCKSCSSSEECSDCHPGRYLSLVFPQKNMTESSNNETEENSTEPEPSAPPPSPSTLCLPCGLSQACSACSSAPPSEPLQPSDLIPGCKACLKGHFKKDQKTNETEPACEPCLKGCEECLDSSTCSVCQNNTKKRVYLNRYTYCLYGYQQNYEYLALFLAGVIILWALCALCSCLARRCMRKQEPSAKKSKKKSQEREPLNS